MLSSLGEHIANGVITLYYSDYAILYPAGGTRQIITGYNIIYESI